MHVGHRIKTAGMEAGHLTRCMAYILRGNNIRRSKDIGETDQDKVVQSFGHTNTKGNAPGPILFFYLI